MKQKLNFRIPLCILLLVTGCSWNTSLQDIEYFSSHSPQELRQRLSKNDRIISRHFRNKKISRNLRKAIHSNIRIYSALASSPSFSPQKIRISNTGETSLFNPTQGYVYFYKDDLRYFNIHGVLIHESVGHPADENVYPLRRFMNTLQIFNPSPLRLLEFRAIASVPAVWRKLHDHLHIPYKPWNILHPVAGSLDCEDVYEWFYRDKRVSWEEANNLPQLKRLVRRFPTDSLPHLLARIYVLILSLDFNENELWNYAANNDIFTIEAKVDHIIKKQKNAELALHHGLQKKYQQYLEATQLNTIAITQHLAQKSPDTTRENLRVYRHYTTTRGITWYDHAPFGITANDNITWSFSPTDSFEDQGGDGPNYENVLGNEDCDAKQYVRIWKKCAALSEFLMRDL
ncbi:hypothetical protein [Candidatus Uabimicrobium amorphum]|uniref:Uncharacterized protein n=1 Tax=Uabimicrobium amorphum TaxID=2596890 RepID=A0A5S9F3X8_UABAM|nr:hypothetical protein [Candidatus Uabimicrobium amorphum]BBM83884.1 hypothetical protein UABAM_02239 [Candidatus Uabimicrobium amorphum]